jgi:hypothetical protein
MVVWAVDWALYTFGRIGANTSDFVKFLEQSKTTLHILSAGKEQNKIINKGCELHLNFSCIVYKVLHFGGC